MNCDPRSQSSAARGYDRASLRAIAAEAGVDQKLIAHFFGSKQQLFVAAVGLPLNPAEVLPTILAGDPATIGQRLAALLVDVLEQPEHHQRLTGVVRAAASEPEVARMLREFLTRELFGPAAEMLGSEDGPFRANLVGSQIVGLVMARYVIQIEPLASMPPTSVAAAVVPTLQRYLLGPLSPRLRTEPQRLFSRANRTISWRASSPTGGRPGLRCGHVQRRATIWRCQRSSVSGVTGNTCHERREIRRLSVGGSFRDAAGPSEPYRGGGTGRSSRSVFAFAGATIPGVEPRWL